MQKKNMVWSINRTAIDFETAENDSVLQTLMAVKDLASTGKIEEAVQLLPNLRFEFDTTYLDSDPEKYFQTTSYSIPFDIKNSTHVLEIESHANTVLLSISIMFEVDLQEDIDEQEFKNWLITHDVWAYGTVCGSWGYASDEGGELRLV